MRFSRYFYIILFALLLEIRTASAKEAIPPIVYSARYYTPQEAKSPSISHLYLINPDGTGRRQITSAKRDDFEPRWSRDGTKIHFIRRRRSVQPGFSDVRESWVYDTRTGKERRFSGTPQVEQITFLFGLPSVEMIAAKRFPKQTVLRVETWRFSDGAQASVVYLTETKRMLPWSKPDHKHSQVFLVQDRREKVVRYIVLPAAMDYSYPHVKARTIQGDFVIESTKGSYIADKNTGDLTLLGFESEYMRTTSVRTTSDGGNQFAGVRKRGQDYAVLTPPDTSGKSRLEMWDCVPLKRGQKRVADFWAPVSALVVGSIPGDGKAPKIIVSGFVGVGDCDWRGGAPTTK